MGSTERRYCPPVGIPYRYWFVFNFLFFAAEGEARERGKLDMGLLEVELLFSIYSLQLS